MRRQPRVLAGILHVGEPTLNRAIASAESQLDVDVSIELISHLPKWEAHRRLYRMFSEDDGEHDVLVKLDADMELADPRLLSAVSQLFQNHHRLDHVALGVDDWMSGERILGISMWRSGVHWDGEPPDLFTDRNRSDARERFVLTDPGRTLVTHAVHPTEEQALRYGAHRALKAARTRKASRRARLESFAAFVHAHPEAERRLALAAVELSLLDERAGRRLVDGEAAPEPELVGRLKARAEKIDELHAAVENLLHALAKEAPLVNSAAQRETQPPPVPFSTHVRASVRRLLGPRPLDRRRLIQELFDHLGPVP